MQVTCGEKNHESINEKMRNVFTESIPENFDQPIEGYRYGEEISISYESKLAGATKKMVVVLPANYDETKKYPVLYFLHGIFGTEQDWIKENIKYVVQNLVEQNKACEMILVSVDYYFAVGKPNLVRGFTDLKVYEAYDKFLKGLTEEIMPLLKQRFSVKEGRENTALIGFSLGGRECLYSMIKRPELFGGIGAFCPAPGLLEYTLTYIGTVHEDGLFNSREEITLPDPYKKTTKIMIVKGNQDDVVKDHPKLYHELLAENEVEHTYVEIDGAHDLTTSKVGVYNFVQSLFME